jgi:hypothetical protein
MEDQRRNRFDPGAFRFRQTGLVMTEVNNFHLETLGVQGGGKVLLGGHANRAAGVIEQSFGFHGFMQQTFLVFIVE